MRRKWYKTPQMLVLGDVKQLTRGYSGGQWMDAGFVNKDIDPNKDLGHHTYKSGDLPVP